MSCSAHLNTPSVTGAELTPRLRKQHLRRIRYLLSEARRLDKTPLTYRFGLAAMFDHDADNFAAVHLGFLRKGIALVAEFRLRTRSVAAYLFGGLVMSQAQEFCIS